MKKIDKLIERKKKEQHAADMLESLWEKIIDHPREGVLLTLNCGGEDRKYLLHAIFTEACRRAKNVAEIDSDIRNAGN